MIADLDQMPIVGMPPAFMGYKIDFATGRILVRVCSHCEGNVAVTNWATRGKLRCTHSICPVHAAETIAKLTADIL